MSVSDRERIDWMEDNPNQAVEILTAESRSVNGHALRMRIDRMMLEKSETESEE